MATVMLFLSLLMESACTYIVPAACDGSAQESLVLLRPSFDMVIDEVEGENYAVINRDAYSYIVSDRPINKAYTGTLTGELAKEVDRRKAALVELRAVFENKYLPKLEESVGLKYWATWPGFDEDPPAIYIGLYRPTEEQMRAVVAMLEEEAERVARKWGIEEIVIKFYETLGYRGMEELLEEAGRKLLAAIEEGAIDLDSLPIAKGWISTQNVGGWLGVVVVYGKVADRVSQEFAIRAVETIRDVIGYEVALVITFLKEEPKIIHDIEYRPICPIAPSSLIVAMVSIPITIAVVVVAKRELQRRRSRGRRVRSSATSLS